MPYATGRVYCDADSHIMESLDWLSELRRPGDPRAAAAACAWKPAARAPKRRSPRPWRARRTPTRQPRSPPTSSPGPRAGRPTAPSTRTSGARRWTTWASRASWCSPPSPARSSCARRMRTSATAGRGRSTAAMADFCSGDRRLIGVGVVPLDDPERALIEINAAIKAGCGAIWIPAAPAGERSPGHPDLDPIWRRLSRGAACPSCCTWARPRPPCRAAYHNNGHPRPEGLAGRRREPARQGLCLALLRAAELPRLAWRWTASSTASRTCAAGSSSWAPAGCRISCAAWTRPGRAGARPTR